MAEFFPHLIAIIPRRFLDYVVMPLVKPFATEVLSSALGAEQLLRNVNFNRAIWQEITETVPENVYGGWAYVREVGRPEWAATMVEPALPNYVTHKQS